MIDGPLVESDCVRFHPHASLVVKREVRGMPWMPPCYRSPLVWKVETEAGGVSLWFGFAKGFTSGGEGGMAQSR